jgi:hypothetical protein
MVLESRLATKMVWPSGLTATAAGATPTGMGLSAVPERTRIGVTAPGRRGVELSPAM